MSVLPTSMSVFRIARLLFLYWMADMSSPKGTGICGGLSRFFQMVWIIFRSPSFSAVLKLNDLLVVGLLWFGLNISG